MLEDKIEQMKNWIEKSDNIVFFGGAGVSTESGIPDFRSTDGVYNMKYAYPPETILSHQFFMNRTKEFYDFYRDKMIYSKAEPNITHNKLQELEVKGKLKAVITQNIDGLHQKAESKKVLELHGSVLRYFCMFCNKAYDLNYIIQEPQIPKCTCNGILKPDVVLYEEPLNEQVMSEAIMYISNSEILIIGGTSLSVYPAAGLVQYYHGDKLILINKDVTAYDKKAKLLINAALGEVFSKI